MGLTARQILLKIELPLSVEVILGGIRTAVVINIGFSALAFLIGGGGLGEAINSRPKARSRAGYFDRRGDGRDYGFVV